MMVTELQGAEAEIIAWKAQRKLDGPRQCFPQNQTVVVRGGQQRWASCHQNETAYITNCDHFKVIF